MKKLTDPDAGNTWEGQRAALEERDIVRESISQGKVFKATPYKKAKPSHYKVICISMYTSDIEQLDAKVTALKRRGLPRMSRSQLIRLALSTFNIEDSLEGGR